MMTESAKVRIENATVTSDREGNLVIKAECLNGARVVFMNNVVEIRPGTTFDTSAWGTGSMYKGNRMVGVVVPTVAQDLSKL
jgi:hypothetical protein